MVQKEKQNGKALYEKIQVILIVKTVARSSNPRKYIGKAPCSVYTLQNAGWHTILSVALRAN